MALSKPLTDELKKDLECSICFQRYQSPRMLPCVHTFCLRCLENCESNLKPGTAFTCPTCRSVVNLPPQGVKGLPGNFFVVNLMEKIILGEEEFPGEAASRCAFCRGGNGQIYCMDCKLYLCNTCRPVHARIPGTPEHILAEASRLSDPQYMKQITSGQAPHCKKHPSEKLKFFCNDCKSLICRDGMALLHQGHKCIEANSRAQSAKAALQSSLGQIDKCLMGDKEQQTNLARRKDYLNVQSRHAKGEIEKQFSGAVARLQSDKQKLLADVDRIIIREQNALEEQESNVASWIAAAENVRQWALAVIEEDNDSRVIRMENRIDPNIKELEEYQRFRCGRVAKCVTRPKFVKIDFGEFYTMRKSPSPDVPPRRPFNVTDPYNSDVTTNRVPVPQFPWTSSNLPFPKYRPFLQSSCDASYEQSQPIDHKTYTKLGNLLGSISESTALPQ